MMSIETHEISFSFDHPDNILNPLLMLLQQSLNRARIRSPRVLPLLQERGVLVIDSSNERARYIAYLLTTAGFRPIVVPTALEAFTRFLKTPFAPCAILLGQEEANDTFFFFCAREAEAPPLEVHLQDVEQLVWDRLPKQQVRSQIRFVLTNGDLWTFSGQVDESALPRQ